MDTVDLELVPIDNPAKLPHGKLRLLSVAKDLDGELPPGVSSPAQGRIFVYTAPTPVGNREWVLRFYEKPEE